MTLLVELQLEACLEDVSAGLVVHLLAAVEHIHHDPNGPGDISSSDCGVGLCKNSSSGALV